eukprot:TRINITY_DN6097_c0_g1_i1.p1 TRINITY_DN6097_c0_g1~~TRINITY_DN6097_c0_g1_i1.p1  ORF type:complete len:2951 (-),score=728.28 TRINITY_DN6097_c0_g1_i1:10-8862(-)
MRAFIIIVFFTIFSLGQNISVVQNEQTQTYNNLVDINFSIEGVYQKMASLVQNGMNRLESSICSQLVLIENLTLLQDNYEQQKLENTENITATENTFNRLVSDLKNLYTTSLTEQSNINSKITTKTALYQYYQNKINQDILKNASLIQVLDSQQTSLQNSIIEWTNQNITLTNLNALLAQIQGYINGNKTYLNDRLSATQIMTSSLDTLLSSMSSNYNNIKSSSQYCLMSLNNLITQKLAANFDLSSAQVKLNYDTTVYNQASATCPATGSCPQKIAAQTSIDSDNYLIAQYNATLQSIVASINDVNANCDSTLAQLNTQLEDTRSNTTVTQNNISSLQKLIATITNSINQLNQQFLLQSLKKSAVLTKMQQLNLTIDNLVDKINKTIYELNDTQQQYIYDTNNKTLVGVDIDVLKQNLIDSENWFNGNITLLDGQIGDTADALQIYTQAKLIIDLGIQTNDLTAAIQNDKLISLFNQLTGSINELTLYNQRLTEYKAARSVLLQELSRINNVLSRAPSNGEIVGTTVIYPFFGNCTNGNPNNCTCFTGYSGYGCSQCGDSSLMNIYYTPVVTTEPVFCGGVYTRNVTIDQAVTHLSISPNLNPEALGNPAYLPGFNATFNQMSFQTILTVSSTGFPDYAPDTFFPFTDYQYVTLSSIYFNSATFCFNFPNSSYFQAGLSSEILAQGGLWRFNPDKQNTWTLVGTLNQNGGSFSCCVDLTQIKGTTGGGGKELFGIGAQICPVYQDQANLQLDSDPSSEFSVSFQFNFNPVSSPTKKRDSLSNTVFLRNDNECHVLYSKASGSGNSFALFWTYYASDTLKYGCPNTLGTPLLQTDGTYSYNITSSEQGGSFLTQTINETTYYVNENVDYTGSYLSTNENYKLSLTSYARTWESCTQTAITECNVVNVSCVSSTSNSTYQLTNCQTATFTNPNTGQDVSFSYWNCTQGTELCQETRCNDLSITQNQPNGTCRLVTYYHVVTEVYTPNAEFKARSDTWRTLTNGNSVIDYPLGLDEPFDITSFTFFPTDNGAPNKKREEELHHFSDRAVCPVASGFSVLDTTSSNRQCNSYCCIRNSAYPTNVFGCFASTCPPSSNPSRDKYLINNGQGYCCSSLNYNSILCSISTTTTYPKGIFNITIGASTCPSQGPQISNPTATSTTTSASKNKRDVAMKAGTTNPNACNSVTYPYYPFNTLSVSCPISLKCPTSVHGDIKLSITSSKRSEETSLYSTKFNRAVKTMTSGDSYPVSFSVTNNGPNDINYSGNGVYIILQFEGLATLNSNDSYCESINANSVLSIWKCSPGNVTVNETKSFSFFISVPADTSAGSFKRLFISSGVDLTTDLFVDDNSDDNSFVESFVTVASTNLSLSVNGGNNLESYTGENYQFEVALTNWGPSQATGAKFNINLPSGFTFISSVGDFVCLSSNQTSSIIYCSFPQSIPAPSTAPNAPPNTGSGQITIYPSSSLPISSPFIYFSYFGNDVPTKTESFPIQLSTQVDLSLDVTRYTTSANSGEYLEYLFTLTNVGPSDATNVTILFNKGKNLIINSTSTNLVCFDREDFQSTLETVRCVVKPDMRLSLFQVRNSQSFVIVTNVTNQVPVGVYSQITNLNVTANEDILDPTKASLSLKSNITHLVDFVITSFTCQPSISAGSNLTIYLEAINLGPSDSTDIILDLQVPQDIQSPTSIVGFPSCTRTGLTTIRCIKNASLPLYDPFNNVNNVFTASMNLFVPTNWSIVATPLVIANIYSSDLEIDISNNVNSTSANVTSSYDLQISVIDYSDPTIAGTPVNFNVTYYNAGPSDVSSVVINIIFNSSQFQAGPNVELCLDSNGISTCQIRDEQVDALSITSAAYVRGTIVTSLTVNPNVPFATILQTKFSIFSNLQTADLGLPNPGNATDSKPFNNDFVANTTSKTLADLNLSLQTNTMTPVPGTTTSYLFNVYNYGPSDARNASINIILPSYLNFSSASSNLYCFFNNGDLKNLTCDFGRFSYADGYLDTLEIDLLVSSSLDSNFKINTTWSITSLEEDLNPANNVATDVRVSDREIDIYLILDLLSYLHQRENVHLYQQPVAGTTWTIPVLTFQNSGPSTASGLVLIFQLNYNQQSNDAVSYVSSTGITSCTGNNGVLVCIPSQSELAVNGTINITMTFFVASSVAEGTPLDFQVCLYGLEDDIDQSNNCLYVDTVNSTVQYNISASFVDSYPTTMVPAQLDTPPIVLKITNYGPSDAIDVVLSHLFSPTISLVTVLPLSSEDLGTVAAGQTASISYYINIPAIANPSYPGAWNLSSGGYFDGNVSVAISKSSSFVPLNLYFKVFVDYVCHNHVDCASCLSDSYLLCGFCQTTQTCHPGQINQGPGENQTDCITWDYAFCQPSEIINIATQTLNPRPYSTLPSYNIDFDLSSQNFTFSLTLDYVRGATWIIDFQSFDPTLGLSPKNNSCVNRKYSDFFGTSATNSSVWRSAPSAAQVRNIQKGVYPSLGTTTYLAYPPPGNYWKLFNVYNGTNIVENKLIYNSSMGFFNLFKCGASSSANATTISVVGNLHASLVAPLTSTSTSGYKVRVLSEYIIPFQFTLDSTLNLVSSLTVQTGAQVTILYIGQTADNRLFVRISTTVNLLGQYFGDVTPVSIGGSFQLQRTYPVFQVQSPFCTSNLTPETSGGTCTCLTSAPCEQIWEFTSTTTSSKRDINFNDQFSLIWSLYQNYNPTGNSINSQLNINYVIFDTVQKAITIPLSLQFYDSEESALAQLPSENLFDTGDSIYVFPFLDANERSQFNITVTTLYVCYLPNNASVLTSSQTTDNNYGCLDPRVTNDFRITLVSGGRVNTNYALASLFNTRISPNIYGGVTFDATPLSVQTYQQYYVHGIYSLSFSNGTVLSRSFVSSPRDSSTVTTPGVGVDLYTLSGSKETKSSPLSTGAIVGIAIAGAVFILIIIVVFALVARLKRNYKKLNNVDGI